MRSFVCSWAVLVVLVGCYSGSPADTGKRESGGSGERKYVPKPKLLMKPDQFTFSDPDLGALFKRMDGAVREIADSSWTHESYWTRSESYVVRANWEAAHTDKTKPGGHSMVLTAYRHPGQPKRVRGIAAQGNWWPKESGWGAYVTYCRTSPDLKYRSVPDSFRVVFRWHPDGEFQWKTPTLEVFRDITSYTARKRFGDTNYTFSVWIDPPVFRPMRISDEAALRWLHSAESLRNKALAKLDHLTKKAKEEISSGEAVSGAAIARRRRAALPDSRVAVQQNTLRALAGFHAPAAAVAVAAIPPPKSHRPITNAEKAIVLGEAIAEIEKRKKLVRDNYKAWFAALAKAFPLKKCLAANRL